MWKFKFMKNALWLIAGFIAGAGLSSTFADSGEPPSIQFKVLAVSEEDAAERASEMLREGALKSELKLERLVAASVPVCKEVGNDYSCETKLTFKQ